MVQDSLSKIFDIQNCTNDPTYFNLKLLAKSLNSTKARITTKCLNSLRKGEVLPLNCRDGFLKCKAVECGDVTEDEAVRLAANVLEQLVQVEKLRN